MFRTKNERTRVIEVGGTLLIEVGGFATSRAAAAAAWRASRRRPPPRISEVGGTQRMAGRALSKWAGRSEWQDARYRSRRDAANGRTRVLEVRGTSEWQDA